MVAALTVLGVGACDRTRATTSSPADDNPSVRFMESNSAILIPAVTGIATALALDADRAFDITDVELVADEGLRVTYLGYSYCQRGCPGGVPWTAEEQKLTAEGLDGTLPLHVPTEGRESRPSLVLLLEPDEAGRQTIQQRCLLVHAAVLTLADGKRVRVTFKGEPIAGVQASEQPAGYQTCW